MAGPPVFFYDFSSPYAYLAAHRVDDLLPVAPRWHPFSFGHLLRATGRVPWSWREDRGEQMRAIERLAAERGLPLRWPPGWPVESYSLAVLRGALVAADHERLRDFSLAAFRRHLGEGRLLQSADAVADVAVEAGVDPGAVREGVADPDVKRRVREATEAALARGVVGIPTVDTGDELFWGDDRLEDAAAALRG